MCAVMRSSRSLMNTSGSVRSAVTSATTRWVSAALGAQLDEGGDGVGAHEGDLSMCGGGCGVVCLHDPGRCARMCRLWSCGGSSVGEENLGVGGVVAGVLRWAAVVPVASRTMAA
jgi:hypothetical protein